MVKSYITILMLLMSFGSKGQSIEKVQNTSLELSFGMSNVGFSGKPLRIIDRILCFDCNHELLVGGGFEFSSQFTLNKKIKTNHEVLLGIGFNVWNYKIDEISGWTAESLGIKRRSIGLFSAMVGYRYQIKDFGNKVLFLQNLFHAEITPNNKFNRFRLSFEPGVGIKTDLNESLNFLAVVSYKRSVNDFLRSENKGQDLHSIGLRLGVSKTID